MKDFLSNHGKKILIGVCILCVLVGGMFALTGKMAMSAGVDKASANKEKIAKLKTEVDALEKAKEEGLAELSSYKHTAATAGNAVASVQTRMAQLTLPSQKDSIVSYADEIKSYASDKSLLRPWFYYTASTVTGNWSFKSSYSFKGDKIKVFWVCMQSASDRVLAYATSEYDAKTNKFGPVTVYQTAVGSTFHNAEEDAKYEQVVDEMLKGLEVN